MTAEPADDARPLTDDDYRHLARFRHALRRFEAGSREAAAAAGLSPAQHQLLLSIRGHPAPPPSISDLADHLDLRLHSATELVARAEANGLVARTADPADRRRSLIALTTAGEEILAALTLTHRDELRRARLELRDVLRELDG